MNFDDMNESGVRDILLESKGDLVVASRRLCIRPAKLQRYIRTIPSLRHAWVAMEKIKASEEYDTLSARQFEDEFESMLAPMRVDALDSIHELATMSHETAAMADVKLRASVALLEAGASAGGRSSDVGGLLAELNQAYQQGAVRMRSLRATVTLELGSEQAGSSLPIQSIPSAASDPELHAIPRA